MKKLIEKFRFLLVSLLIGNSKERGIERFFQNSASYWISKYQAFAKDGTELQKYAAKEIDKYKKERNEYQDKYLNLENKYNILTQSLK